MNEVDIAPQISEIQRTNAQHWSILVSVSCVGVAGYFSFTASLKFISATTCAVLGTIEIVLAYICQGGGSHDLEDSTVFSITSWSLVWLPLVLGVMGVLQ